MTDEHESESDDLLQCSHEWIGWVNKRYGEWCERYGESRAAEMLCMLIATIACSPATATSDPEAWVNQVKSYIDAYFQHYVKTQQGDKTGREN